METIKGVIFDMDGLMFDSERLSVLAWQQAMRERGLEFTPEMHRQIMGRDANFAYGLLRQMFGQDFPAEATRGRRVELRRKMLYEQGAPCKKGLLPLLDFLEQQNIRRAVASSSPLEEINYLLERNGVKSRFHAVFSGLNLKESKPNPEVFLLAAKAIDVLPQNGLVLEDAASGILAAHRGGFRSVLIPDLMPPNEETKQLCSYQAEDLSQVIDIIRCINGLEA